MATFRASDIKFVRYRGTSSRTISWTSYSARDSYFNSKSGLSINGNYAIREGSFRANRGIADLDGYNYGYFYNGEGIRRYFFIDSKVYVDERTTDVIFHLDLITTYLPQGQSSLISRREIPASSTDSCPEQIYNGALIPVYKGSHYTNGNFAGLIALTGNRTGLTSAIVPYSTTVSIPKLNGQSGENTNLKMPVGIMTTPSDAALLGYLEQLYQSGATDTVISAWAVPAEDVQGQFVCPVAAYDFYCRGRYGQFTVNLSTAYTNLKLANDNYMIRITEMANPANAIEIPYNLISADSITIKWCSDPIQGIRTYMITDGLLGTGENIYKIIINTKIDLPTVNDPAALARANVLTSQQTQSPLDRVGQRLGADLSNAITEAGQGDVSQMASLGVGNPVAGVAGLTKLIGMGANSYGGTPDGGYITQNEADLTVAGRQPMTCNGAYSAGAIAADSVGINVWEMVLPDTAHAQMHDSYRKNGYTYNRVETPALRDGSKHLFAGDLNITTDYATASEELQIRELYSGGVWQWPTEAAIYSF